MSNELHLQHLSPETNKPRPDSPERRSGRAPQDGTSEGTGRTHAMIAAPPEIEQTIDSSIHPASDDGGQPPLSAGSSRGATSNEGEPLVLESDAGGRRPAKLHCLEKPVVDLRPHPLNARIYGDELVPDEGLTQSIKEGGVHTPLHVTADNVVIAGHRRLQSACVAGLQTVPVIVVDVDADEFAAAEYLLETNRARQKTHEQIIREFIEFERIETGRAKARMQAGKTHPVSNLTQGQLEPITGKARDIAACKVGLSAGTASNSKAVVETIDRLYTAGQAEEEHRLRTILNEQSYHAAHKEAVREGWIRCPKKKVAVSKTLSMAQVSPVKSVPDQTAPVALAQTFERESSSVDPVLVDGGDYVDDSAALVPDRRPFFNTDGPATRNVDDPHATRNEMLTDKEEVSLSRCENCIHGEWIQEAIKSVRPTSFAGPESRILPYRMAVLIEGIADLVNQMAERNHEFSPLLWQRGIDIANAKLKAVVKKHQADAASLSTASLASDCNVTQ